MAKAKGNKLELNSGMELSREFFPTVTNAVVQSVFSMAQASGGIKGIEEKDYPKAISEFFNGAKSPDQVAAILSNLSDAIKDAKAELALAATRERLAAYAEKHAADLADLAKRRAALRAELADVTDKINAHKVTLSSELNLSDQESAAIVLLETGALNYDLDKVKSAARSRTAKAYDYSAGSWEHERTLYGKPVKVVGTYDGTDGDNSWTVAITVKASGETFSDTASSASTASVGAIVALIKGTGHSMPKKVSISGPKFLGIPELAD